MRFLYLIQKQIPKNILAIFTIILTISYSYAQTSQQNFSFHLPSDINTLKKISLWATQYYIPTFQSGGTIPLLDANGQSTGFFADTCNFCKAALEGTMYMKDSSGTITVLNFAKRNENAQVDCRSCSTYSKSKLDVESWGKVLWIKSTDFGVGVKNYKLIPYRTIAVDSKTIPYGTVIFIPKAKGKIIELPNGERVAHDGYFFAGDTGSAIKGNQIDIFTGIFSGNVFPEIILSQAAEIFEAYVITDNNIIHSLTLIQTK
jgi:3D (Asp-Asp-Asp) domain-containing protein